MRRDFHITMGHGLGDGTDLTLRGEIEMAKIAALYGDSATLISLKAKAFEVMKESMANDLLDWDIPRMRNVASGDIESVFDEAEILIVEFKEAMSKMQQVEEENSRSQLRKNREYLKFKKIAKNRAKLTASLRAEINVLLRNYGFDEIEKLVASGFLNILGDEEMDLGGDPVERFFETIIDIFNQDTLTYPLFDNDISNIVRLAIKEERISPNDIHRLRSKQIALPADFLSRLPNFSNATVAEILDIRKALKAPLIRFRAAIIDYSNEIKNSSWDDDFNQEAEILYRHQIAPAILDIEEAIEENSLRKHLFKNVVANGLAGGALSFVVTNIDAFTDVLGKSASSILGAGLGAAGKIAGEYQVESNKISKNGMYFLYKTNHLLSK